MKEMEFIWRGSSSRGKDAEIFTSVLRNGYGSPPGFDFSFDYDSECEVVNDNKYVKGYNVDKRADEFVNYFREGAKDMATNNLLVPFGNDFNFQNAFGYFQNMDKLIRYINANKEKYKVNMMYSTPASTWTLFGKRSRTGQ